MKKNFLVEIWKKAKQLMEKSFLLRFKMYFPWLKHAVACYNEHHALDFTDFMNR